jgi:predicted deacetylase
MKSLVVSVHDVSPLTQALCEEILAQLRQLGIDQTSLLVIPNHHRRAPIVHDAAFRDWLSRKTAAGHEVVLHGYYHQREKQHADSIRSKLTTEIYTAGEGEFFDLSTEEASIRLQRGLEDLDFLPRKVVGFIAPAWLLGAEAEAAVRNLGFRYTTRLGSVKTFGPDTHVPSQSLVWSIRAPWRVEMSLAWNGGLALVLGRARLIRIGIHPPDVRHSRVWGQVLRLAAATSRDRECVSYESFAESLVYLPV